MSYVAQWKGDRLCVMDELMDAMTLASVKAHEGDGVVYLTELESCGDPGALRFLMRAAQRVFAGQGNVHIAVDVSNPKAERLKEVYSRFFQLEYLMFKVR